MNWVVHKFGGSSLGDAVAFENVGRLLLARGEDRQAVVVSAMGGTTDALIELATAAALNRDRWPAQFEALHRRHLDCAAALAVNADCGEALAQSFDRLKQLLLSLGLVGSVPVEVMDLVSSLGETWSARILAAWFVAQGHVAEYVDAREVIRIERGDLGPIVQMAQSRERLESIRPDREIAGRLVMTGFCCRDVEGRIATLGRNGSDFSATILAALLEAVEVHIWTDVEGVLSADPGRVPQAEVSSHLSYREAFELAYFGARVLHPQTMSPILERGVPVRIRSTAKPELPGTLIDAHGTPEPPVKGVSSIRDLALVNIEGAGMLGVPGTAERVFSTLNRAGISVTMISQGSSEHSICCVLPRAQSARAKSMLEQSFVREIDSRQLQRISVVDDIEVLAVVGDGMAGTPGVSGRLFRALGRSGINVRAIAQGSSERNISVAVDRSEATRALRAVHSAFYLSEQTLSIGLIGPGQVGTALLGQICDARQHLAQARIDLRLRALANSRQMVLTMHELPDAAFSGRIDETEPALEFDRFARHVKSEHLPHAVIIDCTASDEVAHHYESWLSAGIHVITPNKHAGSGDPERYRELRRLVAEGRARWRYEATVGAGLPIVQTLRDLVDSGDRLHSIEGIFSGTLAWLFNRYRPGMSFAGLVREAKQAGYTEPDPRDDLSGMDVARKLVILGREAGMDLQLADVEIESLMPEGAGRGSVEEFLAHLESLDDQMAERLHSAEQRGGKLRYVGRLDREGRAEVGLQEVPGDHPFAHLALTDNVVAFRSDRYCDNPLIVQGPGAGPAVTAAGIFSDLLRIAQSSG